MSVARCYTVSYKEFYSLSNAYIYVFISCKVMENDDHPCVTDTHALIYHLRPYSITTVKSRKSE